jgi:hypothetical protein
MWILHFIPDSFLRTVILGILFTGAGLYGLSIATILLPFTKSYREILRIVATILMVAGVYFYGSYDTEMRWREKVKEAEKKVAVAEEKAKQINTVIETQIVHDIQVVHDKQIVIKNQIKEVEKVIDAKCELDPVVPKIHNSAAENPFTHHVEKEKLE